jgi:hypothetical protein
MAEEHCTHGKDEKRIDGCSGENMKGKFLFRDLDFGQKEIYKELSQRNKEYGLIWLRAKSSGWLM